ncbi:MAG: response regulator [Bacteroidales bacterium]|nr:response regulator [Bacteroidales bacterium]
MNKKFNAINLAIIIGLVLYFIEAFIFYILNTNSYSFAEAFITKVPLSDIYTRLLSIAGVIVLGIIVNGRIREIQIEKNFLKRTTRKTVSSKLDFAFLSSLSYQIRTPLNAIIGFSELLRKPNLSPESKDIYTNHINSSSKYLLLLVNNLSEISKIESNELEINRVDCNINRVIDEIYQVFQIRKEELGKSNISLVIEKVKISESFPVLTDPERLKHVLNNLLESAFIHTEEGMVKIGYTKREDGFIEFYVKDTGRGFSQERLEVIFERYNKLTDNDNMPFDGSLLRLAISKSLVKLLGGNIWADSKLGSGVSIYFTIPYMEVEAPAEEENRRVEPAKSEGVDWSDKQLLITEDIDSNFIYLEELLRPTKIKITWAKNGKQALDIVNNNPDIDIVLMDILMPEMDGYEASREIKKIRSHLPIIAQTAYLVEGSFQEEQNKNFDSYLIKPIWAPQLISSIEKYLK